LKPSTTNWERWSELQVGAPSEQYAFWESLAKREGWTVAFAETVFHEYRKFLYLVLSSGHPVLSPPPIRAALRLHQSLSSWRTLPEASELESRLGRTGTVEETCAAYIQAFGAYPPESIWPRRFRSTPPPKQTARHFGLSALVIGAMGAIWSDLVPGVMITPVPLHWFSLSWF